LNYIVFASGIAISAVAAYYSIIGLTTIFAGSFWSIVIMGTVLEIGKLVAVTWLHTNWKVAPALIKAYLMSAIAILMLITSMGIFGFLSKAYIEQSINLNVGVIEKIQIIDSDIKVIQDSIKDIDVQIDQIDSAITKMTERNQAQSSLRAADQQRKTRDALVKKKQELVSSLSELRNNRIRLDSEVRKIEAEIGPIKYVAELIYGDSDKEIVDKAIRFVIVLLIIVFDPLAVLLLLAFNISKKKDDEPQFLDMTVVEPVITKVKKPRKNKTETNKLFEQT
jgi:hypothetical protein